MNLFVEFFGEKEFLNACYNALLPEMSSKHEKRSSTEINLKKDSLSLDIKAKDKSALKKAINSYLSLIALVEELYESEELK